MQIIKTWLVVAILMAGLSVNVSADDYRFQSNTIQVESALVQLIDSVEVPSELAGVIATLRYREGQMVAKGDEIARIKSDELVLRLKRAEIEGRIAKSSAENDIDVRFAEKSLEVTSAKVARSESSNQRVPGVVPTSRIEEQKLEAHRDQLRVEQAARDQKVAQMQSELASTDVKLSKLVLSKSSIRAPLDGMVVVVERRPGEWVEPGDALVRLVRMDRLKIEGFVTASEASRIRIGDPAIAKVKQPWMQDREIEGRVMFVNPEANPVNSKVQVWVEIDNKDLRLIPGLETSLTIRCQQ